MGKLNPFIQPVRLVEDQARAVEAYVSCFFLVSRTLELLSTAHHMHTLATVQVGAIPALRSHLWMLALDSGTRTPLRGEPRMF